MNSNDDYYGVTTHVVRLKVFRLKTEGEREPKDFFSGIKQLQ